MSLLRLAPVVCAADSSPAPTRALTLSSRSAITRARSDWRERERLGHALQAPVEFGAGAREFAHALLEFALALGRRLALAQPRAARPGQGRRSGRAAAARSRPAAAASASPNETGVAPSKRNV